MKIIFVIQVLLIIICPIRVFAQNMSEALVMIADFADRMCASVPLEGQSESLRLNGTAEAELQSLLKRLVALGFEGVVEYQAGQYSGVIREDIVDALGKSTDCKLEIWNDMKSLIIAEPSDYRSIEGKWSTLYRCINGRYAPGEVIITKEKSFYKATKLADGCKVDLTGAIDWTNARFIGANRLTADKAWYRDPVSPWKWEQVQFIIVNKNEIRGNFANGRVYLRIQ